MNDNNHSQAITKDHLDHLGIVPGSQEETSTLLAHLNNIVNERVGAEITDSLDDTKLEELLELQESGDNQAVKEWLRNNVADLEAIVNDHRDIILGEVVQNASDINTSA